MTESEAYVTTSTPSKVWEKYPSKALGPEWKPDPSYCTDPEFGVWKMFIPESREADPKVHLHSTVSPGDTLAMTGFHLYPYP